MSEKAPKEGDRLSLEVKMDMSTFDMIPAIYTNFASVKIGAEEVQILFALRDDFNATVTDTNKIETLAKPQVMLMMTHLQARALTETLQRQLEKLGSSEVAK